MAARIRQPEPAADGQSAYGNPGLLGDRESLGEVGACGAQPLVSKSILCPAGARCVSRELGQKSRQCLCRALAVPFDDVDAGEQHRRARPVPLAARSAPLTPEPVEHETHVRVRHRVAHEEDGAAERVCFQLDVEWPIESEPIEVIARGQDERGLVGEVAVQLHDLRPALLGCGRITRADDGDVRPAGEREGTLDVAVVVRRVDHRRRQGDDRPVHGRGDEPDVGHCPVGLYPGAKRAAASLDEAVVLGEALITAVSQGLRCRPWSPSPQCPGRGSDWA